MSETRNIVILGGSCSGLGAAHYIAKHTLPQLQKAKGVRYELHIIDPSTHFWWHIAAPRAIISVKEMPHDKCFVPIMDGFKQYSNLKDAIFFHQGAATGMDTGSRTLTYQPHGSQTTETLSYYALVIATGIRSPTPLTTLHGDHSISIRALDEMNQKLASAKDIVIGGGGPVAVETAGEVATHLKGKAKITLVTSGNKLLPNLRKSLAVKAQKLLEKQGVTVLYNTRITGSEVSDGKTEVKFENGKSMTADVYIPAVGVSPNTEFLPSNLRTKGDYVKTNPTTLRVDEAGPRVYAAGDVASVDKGGVMHMYAALPVLGANIAHDLLGEAKVGNVAEKKYKRNDGETQLVPIGAKTGVGAFNGFSMPGFAISMAKGKDYFLSNMDGFTEGKKFVKA